MAENNGKTPLALTRTAYFDDHQQPVPPVSQPPADTKTDKDLAVAGSNTRQPEPTQPQAAPPVPAMLQRARKKSQRSISWPWQRPFDGLRLWAWLLASSSLRKLISTRHREVLVEWREGLNVVVGNEKGGSSKTSVAVLIWLLLAWLLDKTIVLLDFNPAGGHARYRGGVGQTVNMRQFLFDEDFNSIASHRALSEQVGTHPTLRNAYLIDWNDEEHDHLSERLTTEPTVENIQRVLKGVSNISHTTVVDEGNSLTDNWYQSAVTFHPSRSVTVVTFMLDQEFSERGVVKTINAHRKTEPTSSDRTVLVVMNYAGAWRTRRGRKQRGEHIERLSYAYNVPKKRIVVIPHDSAFMYSDNIDPRNGQKLPRVLDPRQFKLQTLAAGIRLLLVIARTSREYRQLHTP